MKNKYISIAAVVLTAMGAFAPNANAAISWTTKSGREFHGIRRNGC